MRKKIANRIGIIGIIISLCFNLNACQNTEPSQPETTPQTKTIALTTDNINEYLFIEDETQNYYVTESPFLPGTPMQEGHADCVINIGKAVPCELYNVVITLEIQTIGYMWRNDDITITLNVPSDGSLSKRRYQPNLRNTQIT